MTSYICIPNWDDFQHYKSGKYAQKPAWIKLHATLRDQPQYLALPLASRGLLVDIWMAYAATSRHLPVEELPKLCHVPGRKVNLQPLIDAGFVRVRSRRPLEQSKSKKKKEPLTPRSGDSEKGEKINPRAAGTNPRARGSSPRQVAEAQRARGVAKRQVTVAKRHYRDLLAAGDAAAAEAYLEERPVELREAVLAELGVA